MKIILVLLIVLEAEQIFSLPAPATAKPEVIQGQGKFLNTKSRSSTSLSSRKYKARANRERYDDSITEYLTERTCFWNELCKEEFDARFKCKCPLYSYCNSPGRYYNAFCSMSGSGYLWSQPKNPSSSFFRRTFKGNRDRDRANI